MLAVPVQKPTKNQMYFEFAKDEKKQCHTAARAKKNAAQSSLKNAQAPREEARDFRELCLLLHTLARKHISPIHFGDFLLLARCTKLLQTLGLDVETPAELQAHVADTAVALVTSAPEYRILRSRAIAGLATVADLASKMPAKGSAEYQRGQRDAYEQASDVAALFLDDLEEFTFLKRA